MTARYRIHRKSIYYTSTYAYAYALHSAQDTLLLHHLFGQIMLSGLFSLRINSEIQNTVDSGQGPSVGDQPVAKSLPTQDNIQEKRGQTSMPRTGFEHNI